MLLAAISGAMTVNELQDLLVATLVRTAGGTQRRWRMVIGTIRLHDPETHPHCNWSVEPNGSAREVAVAENLLDRFRLSHPLATAD